MIIGCVSHCSPGKKRRYIFFQSNAATTPVDDTGEYHTKWKEDWGNFFIYSIKQKIKSRNKKTSKFLFNKFLSWEGQVTIQAVYEIPFKAFSGRAFFRKSRDWSPSRWNEIFRRKFRKNRPKKALIWFLGNSSAEALKLNLELKERKKVI